MTTTQHTPEPWEYKATASLGPQYAIRPEADGPHIAIVYQNGNGEANAARIVACVNACAGLADPAADLAALREALRAALSELEHLTASIETCDLQESTDEAMAKARAALARSGKGEA